MNTVSYSTPAKIHLLGEHTVVYGKPALLAAINLRIKATITPADKRQVIINPDAKILKQTVESVVKKYLKIKSLPLYNIEIESQIPIRCKLGSSAAASASYIAALLEYLGHEVKPTLVNDLAYEAEKVFHGNPAGGDNSTVVFGGIVWFRKEFEFLKIIEHPPFSIHKNIQQFVLINSGRPSEMTREMIALVKQKIDKNPDLMRKIFDDQEDLTKQLLLALRDGRQDEVLNIVKKGERNLEKMGVVGKKALGIIKKVEEIGGSCKILGGGGIKEGSGTLLAYHKNPAKILELGRKYDLEMLIVNLGERGLKKENG